MAVSNAFLLILIENQHVEYKRLKRKTILSDKIDTRLIQKCKISFGSKSLILFQDKKYFGCPRTPMAYIVYSSEYTSVEN